MKIILLTISVFIFILSSCTSSQPGPKLMYDDLICSTNTTFYTMPIGLCEDYPEETTTMDIIRADFGFLKKYDVKFLRISFGWDAIESEKDKYDWLFWDEFVRMAVEDYNITLIPYICYTPNWNSTAKDDMMKFWNHTPVDYGEFGQFMFDLVTRYKKWIKSWEIWNEPDISAFWSGTSADLAKLTRIGVDGIKKADPDAIVVLAGLAHEVEFTRELFRDHGISPFIDVVNMHNYFETWHPSHMETITDYVNEIHQVVEEYGDNQILWMAEVGYSTWRMGQAQVSNDYAAYYDYEHTPEYQAVDLFRRCALVAATGHISAIAWYEIKDLPMQEDVIGDNNNRNLGVAYVDHSPKPAITALKFFNELLGVKYRVMTNEVTINKKPESESHVVVFETEQSDAIIVAWLQTCVYDKRSDDKSGQIKDARMESIKLELPLELSGKATLFNELGESERFTSVSVEDGHSVVENLRLAGGKVAILKITK